MPQKVIEVVGTSKESFAKAAENAVAEAAKTVRGLKWARVAEFEMELDGKKIAQYRVLRPRFRANGQLESLGLCVHSCRGLCAPSAANCRWLLRWLLQPLRRAVKAHLRLTAKQPARCHARLDSVCGREGDDIITAAAAAARACACHTRHRTRGQPA